VDALAVRGEERRERLRKATGSCQLNVITCGYLNGETRHIYVSHVTEYIGNVGEPGELKHLSTQRKRNQPRFRE
jgi:hypothetical protein